MSEKTELEKLYSVIAYLKDALQSSQEPWLKEAYEVCKRVLEAKEGNK